MAKGKEGGRPKGGKKNRKLGNNQAVCTQYRAEGRQEINRLRRIERHLKRHPEDAAARAALKV